MTADTANTAIVAIAANGNYIVSMLAMFAMFIIFMVMFMWFSSSWFYHRDHHREHRCEHRCEHRRDHEFEYEYENTSVSTVCWWNWWFNPLDTKIPNTSDSKTSDSKTSVPEILKTSDSKTSDTMILKTSYPEFPNTSNPKILKTSDIKEMINDEFTNKGYEKTCSVLTETDKRVYELIERVRALEDESKNRSHNEKVKKEIANIKERLKGEPTKLEFTTEPMEEVVDYLYKSFPELKRSEIKNRRGDVTNWIFQLSAPVSASE